MRIRLIALLAGLSLCSTAFAQSEEAAAPAEPAAEKPAAPAAPAADAPAAEAPARQPAAPRAPARPAIPLETEIDSAARKYTEAILTRDFIYLLDMSRTPFFFEGSASNTTEDLRAKWISISASLPQKPATLYGIEILTPEAAIARFGPMPEKLAKWQTKGGMISVANVEGRALFVLWRKVGNGWAAYGVHD